MEEDMKTAPSVLEEREKAVERLVMAAVGTYAAIDRWSDLRSSEPMTPDEKEMLYQMNRLGDVLHAFEASNPLSEGERLSGHPKAL
jgi:hypothetical protein